jgi:hypothetical protein
MKSERIFYFLLYIANLYLTFFEFFWTPTIINSIVRESNRYATTPIPSLEIHVGRPQWKELTVAGLKAFLAFALYMNLKRQPNYKTYWMWDTLFYCPMISNIYTRACFMDLQRCLHITNPVVYEILEKQIEL